QAPALGRGIAEWIAYGAYRTLDLSPYAYRRIEENQSLIEKAVI
ncbi:MAG TPA: FAD-dependent oxidoreductase, partial [Sulfitobacter sp.]|nr:FAD-dependent oxidoreductase [Sulfitobacter sp.]